VQSINIININTSINLFKAQ